MVARRTEDSLPEVTTSEEARTLAADIKARASRLRTVPGMLDGAVEEMRASIERVLRDYDKMSHRRQGPFQRDLEAIAKRAEELVDAGRLSPRHRRIVSTALQHARRVHFWNARRALTKLDRSLEPAREWQGSLDAYRSFHRKAALRARDAEESLTRLRAVPKPGVSPEDVANARAVIEACNRAADEKWAALTHRPVAEALKDLVGHPDVEGLGFLAVQEFSSLRELHDLFEANEAVRDGIGTKPLADLVVTSEFSAAKWDRVYPQATAERRRLQDLFHQLRPVVGGRYGTAFELTAPVSVLERRLAAWRHFPGAENAPAWAGLADLRASGKIPAIQEGARIYERHGDLAKRAFEGTLADEIKEQEKELAAAKKSVEKLPSPESLVG
ncbi:MAG: hypothetical protein E6K18_04625 [Methanobacteriota archaeon]|nr:MAG: hypothetical protein E6K18_04625 [Euryarchaeota archaeon]